jgi:DNA-binding response OmpR family regulator
VVSGGGERATPLILIVDDDPTWSAALASFLKRHRYRPAVAGDGQASLALARSDRPDLVVLDLVMAGVDGMTFLRALRADGALAAVPVIVVTAGTAPGLVEQTAALGVRHHFVKAGHAMRELLDAIRASLPPAQP